jgi:ATP phosphoribosyltransferase regulatory subunit
VFAAYVAEQGRALANGGRYDDVGEVFGRPRPATGFNTDLKALLGLLNDKQPQRGAIGAPAEGDAALWDTVARLRDAGEVVINQLSGRLDSRCDRRLALRDGEWIVENLE